MRLLIVTNDFPPKPGGIQQYLGGLVNAWPGPVRVLAPAIDEPFQDERVVRGPRKFMWPTRKVRTWVEEQVREFGADVVLFGAPYPLPFLGPGLRKRLGVPVAVLGHGAEVVLPSAIPGLRSVFARPLRKADALFAVSRFTQKRLEKATNRSVEYVGGGVDTEVFRPGRSEVESVATVGCVSRFVPRKRHRLVLEAAARLQREGRSVRVLLVGRGRKEASLRRLADRLGVEAEFAVNVPWSELPGLYQRMDVFCMPCRSRWFGLEVEGLGLVFLEASATGIPVLAGDSGGSPETVVEGVTGFVVRSTDEIVDRLGSLLKDPRGALRMGEAGRCRVEEEFTWTKVAERLQKGLERLVK